MCTSVCPTSFGFLSTFLLLLLLSQLFWTTFQCSLFLYPLISVSFILSVFFFFSCCLLLWPLPLLFSAFFYVCCYFNQPACHHTVTIWDVREEQNKKLKRKRERGKKRVQKWVKSEEFLRTILILLKLMFKRLLASPLDTFSAEWYPNILSVGNEGWGVGKRQEAWEQH